MPTWTPYSLNPSQTMDPLNSGPKTQSVPIGFQVGSTLYYVTFSNVGSNSGGQNTFNIWIQKSTNGGMTWTLVQNNNLIESFGQVAVLSGSIIYIFGTNANASNANIWVWRFNTTTDTMLDSGTDLGVLTSTSKPPFTASVFNDGKIIISFFYNTGFTATAVALYNPMTNILGTPINLGVSSFSNQWQVHDPSTDLTIVGVLSNNLMTYGAPNNFTWGIIAIVIDESLTIQTPVIADFSSGDTGAAPFSVDYQSTPVISGGQIFTCYRHYTSGGFPPNNMAVTYSTVGTVLSFNWASPDNLFNFSSLPSLWTFENSITFGWGLAVDGSGTIYCFNTVNSSFNDDSGSQTEIQYQTRISVNSWNAPVTMWTGPSPSSGLMLYPITLSNGGIGLWEAYVNPILYLDNSHPDNQYDSLTVIFLAPAVVVTIIGNCNNPPVGTRGTPYSQQLGASGGTGPYNFTITSGGLPPGLSLSSSGLITGTPISAGTFSFTVTIRDSLGNTTTLTCSITITIVTVPIINPRPCT